MTSAEKALLFTFYTHKLHVEDRCTDVQNPNESMMTLCEELFYALNNAKGEEIIEITRSCPDLFNIKTSDIPQFSNFNDCIYKVPILVQDCGIEDLSFTRLGFMLRVKPRKEGADMKYGENHAKTAAQIGLCCIIRAKIYPSYLGLAFNKLSKDDKAKIYPKLIPFIPYIYNQYAKQATYENINESVRILAPTTQKRRLSNIWKLIEEVNKIIPYEFQIIRY